MEYIIQLNKLHCIAHFASPFHPPPSPSPPLPHPVFEIKIMILHWLLETSLADPGELEYLYY